jgi:hypothetical protein
MSEPSKKSEAQEQLVTAFRAYLQTVITAEQFGVKDRLHAIPGAKTVNYCASLAKADDNTLARELAAPVWAILEEIKKTAMDFHRPLYQKTVKDPTKQAEYERVLWQLDFALALILREFGPMIQFRAKRTKCCDLLCHTIVGMIDGPDAAQLVRRWQKEFAEDGGRDANGSVEEGGFPHDFAWDTYQRVEALDELADEFPEHVRTAARLMHGWPMLAHRHTNNRNRFQELAKRLELGVDYPLDATEGARFRPDTPLVRYLDPLMCKLVYVRNVTANNTYGTAEEESKSLRQWWWEGQDERPSDEEVEIARTLRQLPPLTKATANDWAEKAVVPTILVTDAPDWKNCTEPALQRIAKQKGVKSRATFKSRLLSAVSATLRRLARPA